MSFLVTLDLERKLGVFPNRYVAGCDEVGRGAIAGSVAVGMVVVDCRFLVEIFGVKDSKLLSAKKRQKLVPLIQKWAASFGVGEASAYEIDKYGIIQALGLAAKRAYLSLEIYPQIIILDGNYDWLSSTFFAEDFGHGLPKIFTQVKADMQCLSVAAASVLAKVHRDSVLVQLADEMPNYGWEKNKGYATVAHREAIAKYGSTIWHRKSWNL